MTRKQKTQLLHRALTTADRIDKGDSNDGGNKDDDLSIGALVVRFGVPQVSNIGSVTGSLWNISAQFFKFL